MRAPALGKSEVVQGGLLLAVLAGLFAILQFSFPGLSDADCYYHIKYAYLLRTEGFFAEFKWASFSLWSESFSDKEFLFHVLLIPFTYLGSLTLAAKVASVAFSCGIAASLYTILKLNRISLASFWTLNLFFSSMLLFRMTMTRPHSFSVILALWSIHFIINKQYRALALISFIFAWSYTAFHLPVMMALLVGCSEYLLGEGPRRFAWRGPAYSLAGTVLGNIIHPFFPKNIYLFFVQNFVVPFNAAFNAVQMEMPREFFPNTTKFYLLNNGGLVAGFALVFLLALCQFTALSNKARATLPLALGFLLMSWAGMRYVEYAVPVGILFFSFYLHPIVTGFQWKHLVIRGRDCRYILAGLGALAVVGAVSWNMSQAASGVRPGVFGAKPLAEAAQYLKTHAPKDAVIYHCRWDVSPELFFYDDSHRYMVFLDPTFMSIWNQRVFGDWRKINDGGYGQQTAAVLRDRFRVEYGVCDSQKNENLKQLMEDDPAIDIVFEKAGVFVFKVASAQPSTLKPAEM